MEKEERLVCNQFRRQIFEAICLSTCCNYVIQETAKKSIQQYPLADKILSTSMLFIMQQRKSEIKTYFEGSEMPDATWF